MCCSTSFLYVVRSNDAKMGANSFSEHNLRCQLPERIDKKKAMYEKFPTGVILGHYWKQRLEINGSDYLHSQFLMKQSLPLHALSHQQYLI